MEDQLLYSQARKETSYKLKPSKLRAMMNLHFIENPTKQEKMKLIGRVIIKDLVIMKTVTPIECLMITIFHLSIRM